jgi:3-phosphoshikimate 1-carboxyvinyltransferase
MIAVRRGTALSGRFVPPGDKSITHRAVLFGMLAEGATTVVAPNGGEDCGRSLAAAEALGAWSAPGPDGSWTITGAAMAPRASARAIDCGNSGTTMRLLAGIAAGIAGATTLTGDASLSRRPMARVLEPLRRMGARCEAAAGERPPLAIHGGTLAPIAHDSPVASAQVEACVLLAGLFARGTTSVTLPGPARDHTVRMLRAFGVETDVRAHGDGGRETRIEGGSRLTGCRVRVPGDFSGAAFLLAAAAATPGAQVTACGVSLNPTRTGLLDVLAAMGASIEVAPAPGTDGEPLGDVTVRGPEALQPFDVPPEWVPRLVDEVPAWIVLASAARGTSRVTGASELRVKESDRIVALARNLGAVGVQARELPDGLEVTGGTPRGARIEAHLDHRIVMAFAALGTRADSPMSFDDTSSVATSYPAFFSTLAGLGAGVEGVAA